MIFSPTELDQRDQMRPAVVANRGCLDRHLYLDVLNAGSAKQDRKFAAYKSIAAGRMEDGVKCVQQDVPRRMRRLAQPGYGVHVFESDCSARAKQRQHFFQERLAIGHIDEDQPLVYQVECAFLQAGIKRVSLNDRDVSQRAPNDFGARHLRKALLAFKADDSATRTDALGEQVKDADWPAANINRSPAGLNANLIEKPVRFRRVLLRLQKKPITFNLRAA